MTKKQVAYIKAFKYGKVVVLKLQRSTKELYDNHYHNEGVDYKNDIIKNYTGEWCNGVGGDCEFYRYKQLKKAMEWMKECWEYENVEEITEQEFKDFEGEDYKYIKWEKEDK